MRQALFPTTSWQRALKSPQVFPMGRRVRGPGEREIQSRASAREGTSTEPSLHAPLQPPSTKARPWMNVTAAALGCFRLLLGLLRSEHAHGACMAQAACTDTLHVHRGGSPSRPPDGHKRTSPPQSEASPVAHVGPGTSLKPGMPGADGTKTWPSGCASTELTAALPKPCRGAGGGSRSPGSPRDKALGKSDVPSRSGCAVPALRARF